MKTAAGRLFPLNCSRTTIGWIPIAVCAVMWGLNSLIRMPTGVTLSKGLGDGHYAHKYDKHIHAQ